MATTATVARLVSPLPLPPSSPRRQNSSSLLHHSPLHLAISSAIISRTVCASQRRRYRSGSPESRRLQPRVTVVRGELRHRGQFGAIRVNVFDLAFPHPIYLCLLMRLSSCPAHGETRRNVQVFIRAAVAIPKPSCRLSWSAISVALPRPPTARLSSW
jgi:hypothetical protein